MSEAAELPFEQPGPMRPAPLPRELQALRAQFRTWTQAAGDVTDRARSEQGLAGLFGYRRRLVARLTALPVTW